MLWLLLLNAAGVKKKRWKENRWIQKKLSAYNSKSNQKQETYFWTKKILKNIPLMFTNLILIFMSITKKKYKLIKIDTNTYYLELMFIIISFSCRNWRQKHAERDLIFEEKRQKALEKKDLVVNLLELWQVSVIKKIMKFVEYRHLLVNLKTGN